MADTSKNKGMGGMLIFVLVIAALFGGMWYMNNKKLEEEKAKTASAEAEKAKAIEEAAKKKVTAERFEELVTEKIAAIKANKKWYDGLVAASKKEGETKTLEAIIEENARYALTTMDGYYVA